MIIRTTAYEGAQERLNLAAKQYEQIKNVEWKTPQEVANYFTDFNNTTVRDYIVKLTKQDPFEGSERLQKLCTVVSYMSVYPDSREQIAIYNSVKELFVSNYDGETANKKIIYYVLWMLNKWGSVKSTSKQKYLSALEKQFPNPYIYEIINDWNKFSTSQEYCTDYIESFQDNEENTIISDEVAQNDLSNGDDLNCIRTSLVDLVKIIREFLPFDLEDPYTIDTIYNSLNEVGRGAESIDWRYKISLLITIAKLMLKY